MAARAPSVRHGPQETSAVDRVDPMARVRHVLASPAPANCRPAGRTREHAAVPWAQAGLAGPAALAAAVEPWAVRPRAPLRVPTAVHGLDAVRNDMPRRRRMADLQALLLRGVMVVAAVHRHQHLHHRHRLRHRQATAVAAVRQRIQVIVAGTGADLSTREL